MSIFLILAILIVGTNGCQTNEEYIRNITGQTNSQVLEKMNQNHFDFLTQISSNNDNDRSDQKLYRIKIAISNMDIDPSILKWVLNHTSENIQFIELRIKSSTFTRIPTEDDKITLTDLEAFRLEILNIQVHELSSEEELLNFVIPGKFGFSNFFMLNKMSELIIRLGHSDDGFVLKYFKHSKYYTGTYLELRNSPKFDISKYFNTYYKTFHATNSIIEAYQIRNDVEEIDFTDVKLVDNYHKPIYTLASGFFGQFSNHWSFRLVYSIPSFDKRMVEIDVNNLPGLMWFLELHGVILICPPGIRNQTDTENFLASIDITANIHHQCTLRNLVLSSTMLRVFKIHSLSKKHIFNLNWLRCSAERLEYLGFINVGIYITKLDLSFECSTLFLGRVKLAKNFLIKDNFSSLFQKCKNISISGKFPYELILKLPNTTNLKYLNITTVDNIMKNPHLRRHLTHIGAPLEFETIELKFESTNSTFQYVNSTSYLSSSFIFYRDLYTAAIFLISILGIVGNILSFCVLCRKNLRSLSTSWILIGLTICDTFVLIATILSADYYNLKITLDKKSSEIHALLGYDSYHSFWFSYQISSLTDLIVRQSGILYPIVKTAYTGSVYCTILLTIERYVAVCHPLMVKILLSKKRIITYIILLYILAIVLNSLRWFEHDVIRADSGTRFVKHFAKSTEDNEFEIDVTKKSSLYVHVKKYNISRKIPDSNILHNPNYRFYYHVITWNITMYLIPIPLLIYMNIRIFGQVKTSLQFGRRGNSNSDFISVTLMLLCVSILFITCNGINAIITLYHMSRIVDLADIEVYACLPVIINCSVNFIIYTLLGRKFRSELIQAFFDIYNSCTFNLGFRNMFSNSFSRRETIELTQINKCDTELHS